MPNDLQMPIFLTSSSMSLLTRNKVSIGDIGIYTVTFTGTGGYQLLAGCIVLAAVMAICCCAVFKVRRLNASYESFCSSGNMPLTGVSSNAVI